MVTRWLAFDDDEEGGGGEVDEGGLTGLLSPEALLVLGAVALIVVIVAAVLVWVLVRRLRRNRTVQRLVNEARTQAAPPGPMRELNELRGQVQQLRQRVRGAVAGADEGETWRSAPADLPALAARLDDTAGELGERLTGLARQPEERVRELLPRLRRQVELMEESERTLHRGLDLASLPTSSDDLERLNRDMHDEVQALQAYRDAYDEFGNGRS